MPKDHSRRFLYVDGVPHRNPCLENRLIPFQTILRRVEGLGRSKVVTSVDILRPKMPSAFSGQEVNSFDRPPFFDSFVSLEIKKLTKETDQAADSLSLSTSALPAEID